MDCALVFGGGGGKGAYEVGVWRALAEMGYADCFSCVMGTSVGALNAALFVRKRLEDARTVWLKELNQVRILGLEALARKFLSGFDIKSTISRGLFNQEGLRGILQAYLTDAPPAAPDFYACTSRFSGDVEERNPFQAFFGTGRYAAEYVKINGLSREEEISSLLASAALPLIYPMVGGRRDGGMLSENNVPYLEAVRMGYGKVLAISLGNENLFSRRYEIAEERRGTPHAGETPPTANGGFSDVLVLCPTVSLGNFIDGTLDFSTEGAAWRENLGYENCMEFYRGKIENFFSDR